MIRPATAADAPAVTALWNHVIRETLITFNSQEKTVAEVAGIIEAKAAEGHAFFVAELGGEIAGYASYSQFRGGVGYRYTVEHSIALGDTARGRGLGRTLLLAVEDHARSGGAHSIFAGVSAANPAGRTFHARMGYAEIAVLPEVGFKFGQWLDLVLMQKRLAETTRL